jgi:hypothetical protein
LKGTFFHRRNHFLTVLPDFSLRNIPKTGGNVQNNHKIYKMATKYTKWQLNRPKGHKIYQHLPLQVQNLRKLVFLVWKYGIWQPCFLTNEDDVDVDDDFVYVLLWRIPSKAYEVKGLVRGFFWRIDILNYVHTAGADSIEIFHNLQFTQTWTPCHLTYIGFLRFVFRKFGTYKKWWKFYWTRWETSNRFRHVNCPIATQGYLPTYVRGSVFFQRQVLRHVNFRVWIFLRFKQVSFLTYCKRGYVHIHRYVHMYIGIEMYNKLISDKKVMFAGSFKSICSITTTISQKYLN